MTRAQYETFVNDLHHLALEIGIRPAARAIGIPEERAKKIAQRRNFRISQHRPASNGGSKAWESSPTVPAIEAKLNILAKLSDRTKVNAAVAADKAFDHLAGTAGNALVAPATAIASEQWSKVADRTHGWVQARQQAANVNVAVQVNLPSAEEIAERRAQHKQLDAITALINED